MNRTPSPHPSPPLGGEGARRAGEGDSAWFMVPMRGRRTVQASDEPARRNADFPVGACRRLENRPYAPERIHAHDPGVGFTAS